MAYLAIIFNYVSLPLIVVFSVKLEIGLILEPITIMIKDISREINSIRAVDTLIKERNKKKDKL